MSFDQGVTKGMKYLFDGYMVHRNRKNIISLDNTVIINDKDIINSNTFRFNNKYMVIPYHMEYVYVIDNDKRVKKIRESLKE